MAKQRLMNDLSQAMRQLDTQLTIIRQLIVAVKGNKDVQGLLRNARTIEGYVTTVKVNREAAEAHIANWASESRWKKAKNVAIPKLTAGRNQLRTMVDSAKQCEADARSVVGSYRLLAAKFQLS